MRPMTCRLARRSRSSRPLGLEPLESRQLLSGSLPGTPFSSYAAAAGFAQFVVDNPGANLQTRLGVHFEREMDSTQASPYDAWQVTVDFFRLDTKAFLGHLGKGGAGAPADFYQATIDASGVLRLSGAFALEGSAFGVTFQNATLGLNVALSRGTVLTTVDSLALEVSPDSRTLRSSRYQSGEAHATATLNWVQASSEVAASLPAGTTVSAQSAVYATDARQANTLSEKHNLAPLISQLTPPGQAPKNAKVAARSVQTATTALTLPGIAEAGGINASQGQKHFQNVGPIAPSTYLGYTLLDGGVFGANLSSPFTFTGNAAATSGTGLGQTYNADGSVSNVPFTLNLQWQAVPGDLTLSLARTVTTSGDTITTEFNQTVERGALVTGTLSLAVAAPQPAFAGKGLLTTFTDLTLVVPARKGIPFTPTDVNKSDWQNAVVHAWRGAVQTATDEGVLSPSASKPKPSIKIALINLVQKVIPAVRAFLQAKAKLAMSSL